MASIGADGVSALQAVMSARELHVFYTRSPTRSSGRVRPRDPLMAGIGLTLAAPQPHPNRTVLRTVRYQFLVEIDTGADCVSSRVDTPAELYGPVSPSTSGRVGVVTDAGRPPSTEGVFRSDQRLRQVAEPARPATHGSGGQFHDPPRQ
jgi:hypothetical protein